jgi:hypothetical protein
MISRLASSGPTAIILISLGVASGCATALRSVNMPKYLDISTGEQTAIIEGSKSGFNGYDCYVFEPSLTREIEVNSGKVAIRARCHTFGNEGPDFKYAGFEFIAAPDHRYRLIGYSLCSGCGKRSKFDFLYVEILDVTNHLQVVVRRPLFGDRNNAIKSTTMAVVILRAPRNDFHCELMSEPRTRNGVHMLTPGPATYMVRCLRYNDPFGTRYGNKVNDAYEARMSFDALAGHVYKIDIDEKNPSCIQFLDISRAPRAIDCVPAEKLEELIGRKRIDLAQ